MAKIRIVPKGKPHYFAKYDSKGKLKPNAEQANFLSYFDDHAPTTYTTSTTSDSESKMAKQSTSNDTAIAPAEPASEELPAYVRYLENLIGQVFGLWGFTQRDKLMLLFSQFASLQTITDSEKKKLAFKIEILFHEIYFVCSPFKNKRAAQLGFFHVVVRFIREDTKGEMDEAQLDSNKLLGLDLMRMVNLSARFAESDSGPTVAEMDALAERVNKICAEAVVQECSNFALAERRKKLKRGHKDALVAITEDGMAPAKPNESLKKNAMKRRYFANHLSNDKAKSGEEVTTTPEPTKVSDIAENSDSSSPSSRSNSNCSESSESQERKTETAAKVGRNEAENAKTDSTPTLAIGPEKATTPAHSDCMETASALTTTPDAMSTPQLIATETLVQPGNQNEEIRIPEQPIDEKPEANIAAKTDSEMATVRKPTMAARPRAGRKAKHPTKTVNACPPESWERKRAAPVETLTAEKRIKLQEERDREMAAAVRLLEQDLRLSSDESQNQPKMNEVSSVLAEIGAKDVEARHRYIEYRRAVDAIVSARKALLESNPAFGPSSGYSVDQLLKSVEMSGGLSFAVRRALHTLAASLEQVGPAEGLLTAYAGSLLDVETAIRYLKVSTKREESKATVDKCVAECSYIQIWPQMLQQYVAFLEQVSNRAIGFARENEDMFKDAETATKGQLTLPDQPGTIAYLKLLKQLLTSIRLTVSAVGKKGDVAAALAPLMANFRI